MRYVPVRMVTLVLLGSAMASLLARSARPSPTIIVVHARPAETGRYNPAPDSSNEVKTYHHNVAVHWGDTDPARIVFYPNYFEWFDQSTRLFFDSVGLDWDSLGKKYG